MDPVFTIMIAAFIGVIALVFGIGNIIQSRRASQAESRLAAWESAEVLVVARPRDAEAPAGCLGVSQESPHRS